MVFTLELIEDRWLMSDIDFESESSAEKELSRFLKESPNAIGLPPVPQSEWMDALQWFNPHLKPNISFQLDQQPGEGGATGVMLSIAKRRLLQDTSSPEG